jgi:hypothetical protein
MGTARITVPLSCRSAEGELQPGIRGGIVAQAGAFSLMPNLQGGQAAVSVSRVNLKTRVRPERTRHSARIHDNLVHQPLDRALTLYTQGAVSLLNNQFITDFSGISDQMELNAGAVLVLNSNQLITQLFFTQAGVQEINRNNLAPDILLFNDNQTVLGSSGQCMTCQAIFSDDLSFSGNQSEVQNSTASLIINTLLQGQTVRATNNRLIDPERVVG